MRSLLLAGLLALAPARAAAQALWPAGQVPVYVHSWGGLDLLHDSTELGDNAQVAQNVLTDNFFLEMRPGSTLLTTILPGYPTLYVGDWVSPSGTRYLIAQASSTIYQTKFSGSPVALSSIPVGYNITTMPAFSRLYFADGSRPLWYWDGNSTGTVIDTLTGLVAPICTYTAYKDGHVFCGNIPNESSSRVRVSSEGGANYWYVAPNFATVDNAANVFDFNPDDGDQVTCMASTPWGVFVGKRHSSHMIKGTGNLTYDLRVLDPKIGCVDNRSVQMVYGVLQWLATDGVYGYNGAGPPQLLSRELDPLMKQTRQGQYSEGAWQTILQSDWMTGTSSPTASWSYAPYGGVFPSSATFHDDNRNPVLQGGVGFSSDTLVNIDTVTVPLSIGYARLATSVNEDFTTYIGGGNPNLLIGNVGKSYPSLVPYGATGADYWADSGSAIFPTSNSARYDPAFNGADNWVGVLYAPIVAPDVFSFSYDLQMFGGLSANGLWSDFFFLSSSSDPFAANGYFVRVKARNDTGANTCFNNTSALNICGTIVSIYRSDSGTEVLLSSMTTALNDFPATVTGYINGPQMTLNFGAHSLYATDATYSGGTGYFNFRVVSAVTFAEARHGFQTVDNIRITTSSGSIVSRIFDTGMTTPLAGALSSSYTLQGLPNETAIAFYLRNSTSPNNDMWTSWTASPNSVLVPLNKRYWQYEALFNTNVSSYTPQLTSVSLAAITTGYYVSKVDFIGNLITAWKQFSTTENNPNTYLYWVRTSTKSFAYNAPSTGGADAPAWVAQTNNVNVAASTGSYAQFMLDSTALTNAASAEIVNAVFLRWAEGANIPTASTALDRRYLLCVAISTTATMPDTCLLRQKTGKWVSWSGPIVASAGLFNDQMIIADGGTSGQVYKTMQLGTFDDNGTPIDAVWVSADFGAEGGGGNIFLPKVLNGFWVGALPVAKSSVTIGYQVGKAPSFVETTFSLDTGQPLANTLFPIGSSIYPTDRAETGEINQWVPLQSGYQSGKTFRVEFTNKLNPNYWRIDDYMLLVSPQPMTTP